MHINESAENYLETILMLSKKLPVVRSVDIASELGFKKSSVSIAMKNLREKKHIVVSDAGFITLTASGKQIAEMIYERHEVISSWLIRLGVNMCASADCATNIARPTSASGKKRPTTCFASLLSNKKPSCSIPLCSTFCTDKWPQLTSEHRNVG